MRVLVFSLSLVAAAGPLLGADTGPTDGERVDLALEELFGSGADARPDAPEPVWRPDHGTVVWIDGAMNAGPTLMEFDPVTGDRRALLTATGLEEAWTGRDGETPVLEDLVWRPDGNAFVLVSGDDPVQIELDTMGLTILESGGGAEEHMEFSPDGRRLAWVRGSDLWVYDLTLGREIRLTDDGSDTVFNGVFDWIYEEELAGRDGRAFAWSDDGSGIVWLRLDDGKIPVHHLVDLLENHSRVTEQRYPKAGDPSPRPSLHAVVFDAASGVSINRSVEFGEPLPYVPRFGFTPDGDLWYQVIDRAQEELQLVRVGLETNTSATLLTETDTFWVEPVDGLRFLDDGSFLWLSRRSGHTHLVRIRHDGSVTDLSPGAWDVTEVVGVDSAQRFAWYQAARPGPLERRLYRVDLANGNTVELGGGPGTHAGEPDPSTDRLLINTSSLGAPPRWKVVDGRGANAAEVPVEHPIPRIDFADHRFIEVTADDGLALNAMLLLPPGFDETLRFPVVVYTYGGPHAQVVRDLWPRTSGLFNHALAGRGFVVFALDNRGSAARGRSFEGAVDLALGSSQLPDQLAGVAWLASQPWVDADRIGIWGWSYGGYMVTYALAHAPGVFAAGAAVAPVTDWRLYDSIYTERYMGLPESNPAGYAEGSILDAVGKIDDPLLVIHGTGDDNVHVQHSVQLADRAWRARVRFDLMLFPNLAHGINAPGSHLQLFSTIADFFEEHLMEVEGNP